VEESHPTRSWYYPHWNLARATDDKPQNFSEVSLHPGRDSSPISPEHKWNRYTDLLSGGLCQNASFASTNDEH
jgi:hypothetical protein